MTSKRPPGKRSLTGGATAQIAFIVVAGIIGARGAW
jgi:hypothetical protein